MIEDCKQLLAHQRYGVLSTNSVEFDHYPFGSVVLYALSDRWQPLIYISDLAEHTRNIQRDRRVSLTVISEGEADPQAKPRATLLGEAHPLTQASNQSLYDRFFDTFPHTKPYQNLDFELYHIDIIKVRFIGGFGKMGWISSQEW